MALGHGSLPDEHDYIHPTTPFVLDPAADVDGTCWRLSLGAALVRTEALAESEGAVYQGINDGTFKSRHLKLLNPQPNVRETFSIAGVTMFLEIHGDLGIAVASF